MCNFNLIYYFPSKSNNSTNNYYFYKYIFEMNNHWIHPTFINLLSGLPLKSTYFIGPYDLLIPKSSTNYPAEGTYCSLFSRTRKLSIFTVLYNLTPAIKEKNIGQSFTLELRSSNPHPFFVKPIYANNKSLDGTRF